MYKIKSAGEMTKEQVIAKMLRRVKSLKPSGFRAGKVPNAIEANHKPKISAGRANIGDPIS